MPVLGSITFSATLHNITTNITAIVVEALHKNLFISWQDVIQLRVINLNFPAQMVEAVFSASSESFDTVREKIVNQFQETLSEDHSPDPMEIPGKVMHIYLQPNAIPSQISISRRSSLHAMGSHQSDHGSIAETGYYGSHKTSTMVCPRIFCTKAKWYNCALSY